MDLSYAQNMEDMHLARLFAGEGPGFYIDVGGGHPVADNVSFRSYLAGWCGIVVEPQDGLHRLYASVRPRDFAARCLVGRSEGVTDFHMVDKLHGFSTTVQAHADGAAGFGASYATSKVPMTTLAALCAAHAPPRIDWLKVDVEGAEPDVLAGNDWQRFRPRIVLVEAIMPGTMEPSHEGWEPMLLGQGYHFGFFDGLNRWYVAEEASDLLARFPEAYLDWGSVRHLYDCGRAQTNMSHPDHALAIALTGLDAGALPLIDANTIFGFLTKNLTVEHLNAPANAATVSRCAHLWLGSEIEHYEPGDLAGQSLEPALKLLQHSDMFRAALGRIAAAHDGGFIMDEG
jgi:FkbM family methyltransferase